jgi:hypothetical protein
MQACADCGHYQGISIKHYRLHGDHPIIFYQSKDFDLPPSLSSHNAALPTMSLGYIKSTVSGLGRLYFNLYFYMDAVTR